MSPMAIAENGVCESYDGLVEDCEAARHQWNERRAEIGGLGLRGRGIDDELRSLQAKFARSYALVRSHLRDCDSCQSTRRMDHGSGHEGDGRLIPEFRLSLLSGAHFAGVEALQCCSLNLIIL
jgi:hypothetical protein